MRTIKQIADTITVNWARIGFDPQTEQTKFIGTIKMETFEFSCGLMACFKNVPKRRRQTWETDEEFARVPKINPLDKLAEDYRKTQFNSNELDILKHIRQGSIKAAKNVQYPHVMRVFYAISNLCFPTAYDLIYCLQSDSRADEMTFEDFCGDFGYDNDSIKAKETYNACCCNAKKLRKALGNELYKELMEAQEE